MTSISSGLLMTAAGLLTRGPMLAVYVYVHSHHRLLELPWDSPFTWLLAAVAVDCGYYWFHRASHEVALLWAVHQVTGHFWWQLCQYSALGPSFQ